MPLTIIPNQPINLDPYVQDDCLPGDNKAYCALYNLGDTFYFQAINRSCNGELFCNPNFEAGQGTEITVTNPNFTGSLTGWSIGVGSPEWSWDASNGALLTYNGTMTPTDKAIIQTLSGLVTGMSYTVSFTIRSYTSTTGLGIDVILGGTSIGTYTANGNYNVNIIAGGAAGITFIRSAGTDGSLILDGISIVGLTDCFTEIGTGWNIDVGGVFKASGTASNLVFPVTTSTTTVPYFKVVITVENRTAGTLTVDLDGFPIATITDNGQVTGYNIASIGGGDLTFAADADFDGTITYLSVEELAKDYIVNIINNITGAIERDITSDVQYINDRIIINSDTTTFSNGCYLLQIIDPCSASGTEIFTNPDYSGNGTGWTLTTADCLPDYDCYAVFFGNELAQTPSETGNNNPDGHTYSYCSQAFDSDLIITEDCYLKFEIEIDPLDDSQAFYFYVGDGAGGYTNLMDFTDRSAGRWTRTQFFAAGSIDPSSVDMGIYIFGSFGSGKHNIVKYAQITKIAISGGGTMQSNCFEVADSHDCAKLLVGTGATGTTTNGFLWQSFALSHRIQFLKFNPEYPIEGDDYEYSDGARKLTFGKREKYYVGLINFIDETAHDTISAQVICENFLIDNTRYFVRQQGYKPEWNKDGRNNLSQSRIELRKTFGTIYSK